VSPSLGPLAALWLAALAGIVQPRQVPWSFGPNRCGPIDPAYVRTASETGGQPFPLAPSEIARMGVVMAESSRSDAAMILWAGGTAADAQGGFVVPVDRSVRRLTFSITFDGTGGSAEIVKPDGAVVQAGAGDTILNCGRILSVDAPEAGDWRVTPVPSSRFWMTVHARSDRDLLTAEFVRRAGRPGHEGLFRINGSPIAGRPGILRIALSDPEERPPVFELFSAQGRSIQRVLLDQVADDEFVGEIALPSVPFRVGISATDADGGRYQRVNRRLFRAESVEVVPPVLEEVRAGTDAPIGFILRNYGEPARYRLTATVGAEVLTRVEPPAVDLATDSEQRVTVWLPARTIAAAGSSLEMLVVASSEDPNESSMNSALLRLAVVKP
jgi:von Willebrand factor A domain-containing protein 7